MEKYSNIKIGEIASFNFGYHSSDVKVKGMKYLQVKNFDEYGLFLDNVEFYIDKEEIKPEQALVEGDVLFVSKGFKIFAYKYENDVGDAVASSVFYVMKLDQSRILPDYLVCILNQPKSVRYFNSIGAGTSIPSIRKSELNDFEIKLPPLEVQHKIVDLYKDHQNGIRLLNSLKDKKQSLFNQVINELTK